MYLQSPRRMCAPIHKRPPFNSRMRVAIVSARPSISGVKINECTTMLANLLHEGSSVNRIAPFRMEWWVKCQPCKSETGSSRVYTQHESPRPPHSRHHPRHNNHLSTPQSPTPLTC